MLIRIRTPENETIRLQVDSSTNFSDLLAQAAAAASCSLDAASLSLNGTDAIVAVSNASVAEAGLAQGDLIYLLVRAEGDETATPSPSDTRQAPPIAALPPSPIKAQGEASGTGDETVTPSPSDIAPPVAALPPPIREASGTIAGTSARAAARRRLGRHLRQDKVAKRRGLTVGLTVPQSPAESGGSAEEAMPDGAVTEATPDGAVAEQATPDEGVTAPVGGPLAAITPPPPLAASCREEELRKATLNKWKVLLFGKSSPDKGLKPLMRRLRRLKAGGASAPALKGGGALSLHGLQEAARAAVQQAQEEGLELAKATRKDNSSGYANVSLDKTRSRNLGHDMYTVRVRFNGKRPNLGWFSTAEEAALAFARHKAGKPKVELRSSVGGAAAPGTRKRKRSGGAPSGGTALLDGTVSVGGDSSAPWASNRQGAGPPSLEGGSWVWAKDGAGKWGKATVLAVEGGAPAELGDEQELKLALLLSTLRPEASGVALAAKFKRLASGKAPSCPTTARVRFFLFSSKHDAAIPVGCGRLRPFEAWADVEGRLRPAWSATGHKWLGLRVARRFHPAGRSVVKCYGTVTSWVPADETEKDPPLWRIEHDDGDKEDLEEEDVRAGIELFQKQAAAKGRRGGGGQPQQEEGVLEPLPAASAAAEGQGSGSDMNVEALSPATAVAAEKAAAEEAAEEAAAAEEASGEAAVGMAAGEATGEAEAAPTPKRAARKLPPQTPQKKLPPQAPPPGAGPPLPRLPGLGEAEKVEEWLSLKQGDPDLIGWLRELPRVAGAVAEQSAWEELVSRFRVGLVRRTNGAFDRYYRSLSGKVYCSRAEIAKAFNFAPPRGGGSGSRGGDGGEARPLAVHGGVGAEARLRAQLLQTLRKYFGHEAFRGSQEEVILKLLQGNHVFYQERTGLGKSLVYQLPALLETQSKGRITLVISPLRSLMQNQVMQLNAAARARREEDVAIFLDQSCGKGELASVERRRLVYCTPEKLFHKDGQNDLFKLLLKMNKAGKLLLIAIDEAQCVRKCSSWRPSFALLASALSPLNQLDKVRRVPKLLITPMAGDEAARSDIFERLGMRDVSVFRSPSLRSELSIRVHIDPFKSTRYGEAMAHSLGWLIAALQKEPEFTLVLVSTTKLCENVCKLLRDYEVSADCFHAQMAEEDKKVAQSNFEEAKVLVFVATMGSFGMGVHSSKPIKHVVHYGAPQSLEDYYNEVGRAGRDGAHARCTLILTSEDITKYSGGMWTKDKDAQQQEQQLDAIRGVREFALNCEKCRWQSLTERLDDGAVVDPCGMCDVCCAPLAAPPKAEFGSIFAFLIRLVYEATRKGESYTPQTWRELWVFARSSTALRAEESKLPAAVRTSGPRAGKMLGACLSFLLAPQGLVDISLRSPSNYGRGWGQGFEQFALSEAGLALYKAGLAGLSYRAPLPPMLYFLPPGHECGSTRPAGSLLEVAAEAERPSPRLRGRRTACAASCGCPLADGAIECSGCVTWFHPACLEKAEGVRWLRDANDGKRRYLCASCKELDINFVERVVGRRRGKAVTVDAEVRRAVESEVIVAARVSVAAGGRVAFQLSVNSARAKMCRIMEGEDSSETKCYLAVWELPDEEGWLSWQSEAKLTQHAKEALLEYKEAHEAPPPPRGGRKRVVLDEDEDGPRVPDGPSDGPEPPRPTRSRKPPQTFQAGSATSDCKRLRLAAASASPPRPAAAPAAAAPSCPTGARSPPPEQEPPPHLLDEAMEMEVEEPAAAEACPLRKRAMDAAEAALAKLPPQLRRSLESEGVRRLRPQTAEALTRAFEDDQPQAAGRLFACLFACRESGLALAQLDSDRRDELLEAAVVDGGDAAIKIAKALPGGQLTRPFFMADEDELAKQGSCVVYKVELDAEGKPEKFTSKPDTSTVAHSVLGSSNLLRVVPYDLSEFTPLAKQQAQREQCEQLGQGIDVLGRRFKFLAFKTDHKMAAMKMIFVATAASGETATARDFLGAGRYGDGDGAYDDGDDGGGLPRLLSLSSSSSEALGPRCWSTPEEARGLLGSFGKLPKVHKFVKRLELMLSHTLPVLTHLQVKMGKRLEGRVTLEQLKALAAAPRGTALVVICDDIPGLDAMGRESFDPRGAQRIMTDGAGLVSISLAKQFPAVSNGRVVSGGESALRDFGTNEKVAPLVTQLRAWVQGSLAKGTVTACPLLADGIIVLRRSMLKIDAIDPGLSDFSRIEICGTSERASKVRLNASFVPLLMAGAKRQGDKAAQQMYKIFEELQDEAVKRIRSLTGAPSDGQGLKQALERLKGGKLLSSHERAGAMLHAGFTLQEPRLREELNFIQADHLARLRRANIPVPNSYVLLGIPDQSGTLEEGEVVVIHGGNLLSPLADCSSQQSIDVLVYKPPGAHEGDVRKLRCLCQNLPKQLSAMLKGVMSRRANAVILSTKGERATGDKSAGSDYDGDLYSVIAQPQIVALFDERTPWDVKPLAKPAAEPAPTRHDDPQALQQQLLKHYMHLRYDSAPTVGTSAVNLMAFQDRGETQACERLVDIYNAALDAGVTGEVPSLPDDLRSQVRPIWMRERYAGGKGLTFEDTDSAMCKLYTRLAPESTPAATGFPQVLLDPDLRALATSRGEQRPLVELWKGRVVQYKSLVRDILSKPQPPLLSNEDEEAARRQEIKEIGASYRKLLLANHDQPEGGWDIEVEPPRSLLIEACLVYKVTYEHEMAKRRGQDKRPTCEGAAHGASSGLAFPWVIATDFLCRAKELKVKQQALHGRRP